MEGQILEAIYHVKSIKRNLSIKYLLTQKNPQTPTIT